MNLLISTTPSQVKTGVAMFVAIVMIFLILLLGLFWLTLLRGRRARINAKTRQADVESVPDPWTEAGRRATPVGRPGEGPVEPGSRK